MIDRGFLYRRLASIFPVCFPHLACGGISLTNKHQIASFSEVFLNPHYWRLFERLSTPPKVIVDLGGNCGFFPVLCEIIAQSKFGESKTEYYVFEAIEAMIPNIAFAARQARIEERVNIIHGAVGKRNGRAVFTSGPKSFLDSSTVFGGEKRRFRQQIDYINLEKYFEERDISLIDVLKIDIEGSEYDLIETFPHLFDISQLIFIELHDIGGQLQTAIRFFEKIGLTLIEPVLRNGPHELLVLCK